MTEKEKAEEIFNKMYDVTDDFGLRPMYHETAKKCALIAVDEVIKEIKATNFNYDVEDLLFNFWHEVRQEIEKL